MMPLFRTDRLYLRHLTWRDVPILATWRSDEACRRYQCWKATTPSALRRLVLRYGHSRLFSKQHEQHYAVCLRNGTLVGDITVFYNHGDSVSIGYTVYPPYQRQGYAYELLSSLLPQLQQAYLLDIFAVIHSENIASIRLIKKLNFVLFKEQFEQFYQVYSMPYRG